MNVDVDPNICGRHGLCCSTAPEVFHLDAAGLLVFLPEVDESYRAAVEAAADECPTQAIVIDG